MGQMKFEKLEVWKKALQLAADVHDLTRGFPKEELYILTTQIKRAADSIVLNIAEGSFGQSDKEFNRFLGFALRSGMEVVACLHLAKTRNLISQSEFDEYREKSEHIIRMIQSFRNTLQGDAKNYGVREEDEVYTLNQASGDLL